MSNDAAPPAATSDPVSEALDELALRAILRSAKRRGGPNLERSLLEATEDLTSCCAASWERLRSAGTTSEQLYAELQQMRFLIVELQDRLDILGQHIADRPPRRRHHYSPRLRFRILEHHRKFMLTVEETGRRFYVSAQTLYNWLAELRAKPGAQTIESLLKPIPPVRRFSDAVRRLCRQMNDLGFGGKKKIAELLLRDGWKLSTRSVGRFINERSPLPGALQTSIEPPKLRPTTVRGDYPNHLWLVDITEIPTVFKCVHFHVTTVLDAYSRLPLASKFSVFEPTAKTVIALLDNAIRAYGPPRHLVTDQGTQFTAEEFHRFTKAQHIRVRRGAVGEFHSIGLIDRFFRTLKEGMSLRSFRVWNPRDAFRRLRLATLHYSYVRPHSSLGGMTPVEVYFGIRWHLPRPVKPPRGRPGEPGPKIPFDFVFLDPEHRALPVLVPKAA